MLLVLILSQKPNDTAANETLHEAIALAMNLSTKGNGKCAQDRPVCVRHLNLQLVFALLITRFAYKWEQNAGSTAQAMTAMREMLALMFSIREEPESTAARQSYFFLRAAMVLAHEKGLTPMWHTDSSGRRRFHSGPSAASWAIHLFTTRVLGRGDGGDSGHGSELLPIAAMKPGLEALDRILAGAPDMSLSTEFEALAAAAATGDEGTRGAAGDWHSCMLLTLLGGNWTQAFAPMPRAAGARLSPGIDSIVSSVVTQAQWPLHCCTLKVIDAWTLRIVQKNKFISAARPGCIIYCSCPPACHATTAHSG